MIKMSLTGMALLILCLLQSCGSAGNADTTDGTTDNATKTDANDFGPLQNICVLLDRLSWYAVYAGSDNKFGTEDDLYLKEKLYVSNQLCRFIFVSSTYHYDVKYGGDSFSLPWTRLAQCDYVDKVDNIKVFFLDSDKPKYEINISTLGKQELNNVLESASDSADGYKITDDLNESVKTWLSTIQGYGEENKKL